jgi:hypothetical protein
MPLRKYGKGRRRAGVRRRAPYGRRLRQVINPRPIFTEMYELTNQAPGAPGYQMYPNTGAVFRFNMDHIPQLAQYSALYQKYRILKAKLLILPEYSLAEQNQAEENSSQSRSSFGQSRVAFAVNTSPAVPAPATELDVLKDNGARVRSLTPNGIRMSCSPVPNVSVDSNQAGVGNQSITFRKKFLNLAAQNGNIDHYGISWWLSQIGPVPASSTKNLGVVYVKLTFQLADPR